MERDEFILTECYIAGLHIHVKDKATVEHAFSAGKRLHLVREPDNEFDPNAVRVDLPHGRAATKVGYIPRVSVPPIAAMLDNGYELAAEVCYVNPTKHEVIISILCPSAESALDRAMQSPKEKITP